MEKKKWIKLVSDSWGTNLGGDDPDDEWTRDSSETNHTFTGLELSNYGSFPSDNFEAGDDLYCVAVVYETGDSFGSDTAEPELVYVSKEEYDCIGIKEAIEKEEDSFSLDYKLLDGQVYTISKPWNGYFERLESCEVLKFNLKED